MVCNADLITNSIILKSTNHLNLNLHKSYYDLKIKIPTCLPTTYTWKLGAIRITQKYKICHGLARCSIRTSSYINFVAQLKYVVN